MPIYTLQIGKRRCSINAHGERGALSLARSMLSTDLPDDRPVQILEGDGDEGPAILRSTVAEMLAVGARQPLAPEGS